MGFAGIYGLILTARMAQIKADLSRYGDAWEIDDHDHDGG